MRSEIDIYVARIWSKQSLWGMRRRRRRIAWGIGAAVLLLLICLVVSSAAERCWVMCMPDGTVNVRSRATTHSQRVGGMLCGDEFEAARSYKGWYYSESLWFETCYGWISADYVVTDPPTVYRNEKVCTVTANGRVAAWEGMTCKKRLSWVKPGTTVTVYAVSQEWALTDKGYIHREYVKEKDRQ